MGRNARVSTRIIRDLKSLPGRVHAAGLEEAIFTLPMETRQDSGRAAFNWIAESGKSAARVYYSERGIPPVGERGENRTDTGSLLDAVSLYRVREAQNLLKSIRDGSISESTIANNIEEGDDSDYYARNAKLRQAMNDSKQAIESAMKEEVKAWHREHGNGRKRR